MSKRQTIRRKSTPKVSVVSVNDCTERQSTVKSTRVNRKLSIESPNKSPIRSTHQSPIRSKELPNLSQYFPSRKRSQSSPRNQSPLDRKYTRLKSPNNRFRKRLLNDNPISYGEFEDSFDENSSQELIETQRKPKVKRSVDTKNKHKDKETSLDLKGFLTSFQSVMDEVIEDDIQLTADQNSVQQSPQNSTQQSDGVESLAQMISSLATGQEDHCLSPIPCHSRDIPKVRNNESVIIDRQKAVTVAQEVSKQVLKVDSKSCDSKANQNNSFDEDFDDSLDGILSQMTFSIEDCVKSVPNCSKKDDNIVTNERNKDNGLDNNEIMYEEDDGFESDGDFERMLTQIPNEELVSASDLSDSALDTSMRNMSSSSLASSGLITLSQIIELINRD